MSEPLYLGVNELGIPVYEIEQGSMRPMVDKDGKIVCKHCSSRAVPLRISLAPGSIKEVEWALLCCPHCHAHHVHCLMKVKIMGRMMAGAPSLTEIDKEETTHFVPDGRGGEIEMLNDPRPESDRPFYPDESMRRSEMTGGKTHYDDPKEKARKGIEAAVAHGKKRTG